MDSSGSAKGPVRALINTRVNVRLWKESSIVSSNLSDRYTFSQSVMCSVELF